MRRTPCAAINAPLLSPIRIRITHPCHPLFGTDVEFRRGPRTRCQSWIFIEIPGCGGRMVPVGWTSLATPDSYAELAPPPLLRLDALRELVELISQSRRQALCEGGRDRGSL